MLPSLADSHIAALLVQWHIISAKQPEHVQLQLRAAEHIEPVECTLRTSGVFTFPYTCVTPAVNSELHFQALSSLQLWHLTHTPQIARLPLCWCWLGCSQLQQKEKVWKEAGWAGLVKSGQQLDEKDESGSTTAFTDLDFWMWTVQCRHFERGREAEWRVDTEEWPATLSSLLENTDNTNQTLTRSSPTGSC